MQQKSLVKENALATQPVGKLMVKFALPAIASSLVNSLYNIVDQIFIGHDIGALGNAATNVAFPLVTIAAAVFMLLGVGGASNFSLKLGAGEKDEAGKYVGNALLLTGAAGVLLGAAALLFLEPMLYLFGARGEVMRYAKLYTGITAFGIPFSMLASAGSQFIRADGSPKYAMASVMSGAVLNTILDPILIFGFGMGIRGAALATIAGQFVSAAIVLAYFRRFKTLRLEKKHFTLSLRRTASICRLGVAAMFNQLAGTLLQIVLNNTLGHYGELSVYGRDIPLACVGIVSKVNTVFLSVIFGIAQSCQPIFGYNYGAGNYKRVKQTYRRAAVIVTGIASAATLCFQLFPRQIMNIFGSGEELYYQFGVRYFRIFLLFTFINGLQILSANFFTSIGRANKGIVLSLSRQIILLLPLLLLLPRLFGIDGVLYAGPIADAATGVLTILLATHELRAMDKLKNQRLTLSRNKKA